MNPIIVPDWRDFVAFSPEGPQPRILAEIANLKVILGGLEADQRIPTHPEGLATYCFLEGNGWMTVEDERFAVRAGMVVITPAGARRGVEAESRLAFLASRIGQE